MLAAWEACLLLQNTLASGPLLSPVWHLDHRSPLETLAVALMYQFSVGERGRGQFALPSICPSVCPSIIHLLS